MRPQVNRLRINNSRFSVRVCTICEHYGITTVGQLRAMVYKMSSPNAKVCIPNMSIRKNKIILEIKALENETIHHHLMN